MKKAIFGALGPKKYQELSKFEYGSRFRKYRIACQIVNQCSACHRRSVTSGSRTRIGMASLLQIVLPEYFCLRFKICPNSHISQMCYEETDKLTILLELGIMMMLIGVSCSTYRSYPVQLTGPKLILVSK